jgi:site-specific DNA-methyltransferase (adenine-specific)
MTMLAPPSDSEIESLAANADRSDLVLVDLPTLYDQARYHREQAEAGHQMMLRHFLELGRRLIEIRERVPHGEFIATIGSEIGVSDRYARYAMELSRNRQRVSDLPPETTIRQALEQIHTDRRVERAAETRNRVVPRIEHLPENCVLEVADAADLPVNDGLARLIITSPPYGLGIDYVDTDDNEGYATYQTHSLAWAEEMFRVAAPNGGRLCLNIPLDVTYGGTKPLYADWVETLQDAGWQYRTTIVWNEGNVSRSVARGSPNSANAPHVITRVEMIAVMYRGDWNLGRTEHGNDLSHEEWLAWTNGMWEFPGTSRADHPAPFPEELPNRCMKLFSYPGDVILDPFVGSGTTAIVARSLGRPVYGFDHSPRYIDQARVRLVAA